MFAFEKKKLKPLCVSIDTKKTQKTNKMGRNMKNQRGIDTVEITKINIWC